MARPIYSTCFFLGTLDSGEISEFFSGGEDNWAVVKCMTVYDGSLITPSWEVRLEAGFAGTVVLDMNSTIIGLPDHYNTALVYDELTIVEGGPDIDLRGWRVNNIGSDTVDVGVYGFCLEGLNPYDTVTGD
jgi:hypothetical protein